MKQLHNAQDGIEQAIEGGWPAKFEQFSKPLVISFSELTQESKNDVCGFILEKGLKYEALTDPLFWQALGKERGWKQDTEERFGEWLTHSVTWHREKIGGIYGDFKGDETKFWESLP